MQSSCSELPQNGSSGFPIDSLEYDFGFLLMYSASKVTAFLEAAHEPDKNV